MVGDHHLRHGREVAGGADGAALRDHRDAVPLEEREDEVEGLLADAAVAAGEADAMLCGMVAKPQEHLRFISEKIGRHAQASVFATMNILLLPGHTLFICDTHINLDPSAEQLAEITLLAVAEMRRFGIEPVIEGIAGVASASINGGRLRQINVVVDPVKAQSRGVTSSDVAAAVSIASRTGRPAARPAARRPEP